MTGRTLMRVLRYTENVQNLAIEEHRKPLKDTVARIMQPRSFQGEDLTERKRMSAHRAASSGYVGDILTQYGSNTPPSSSTFFISFSTCSLTGRAAYPSTSIPHPLPFPNVERPTVDIRIPTWGERRRSHIRNLRPYRFRSRGSDTGPPLTCVPPCDAPGNT